jgi:hypothetical protein
MKFTNNYNLPLSVFKALSHDSYDFKDKPDNIFSVTDIIQPPKIKTLEKRHEDEIEVDVSERMWMLMGTACHYVIENASTDDDLAEERWFLDVNTLEVHTSNTKDVRQNSWYDKNTVYVSGKLDIYVGSEKKLSDYKITTVWSWVTEKKIKPEHEAQLNINALSFRKLGFAVDRITIMAFFRDWSKNKSLSSYPDLPVPMKEIEGMIWTERDCVAYIRERVKAHLISRKKADDEIEVCSPSDRWARPTQYAVMKEGRKSAVKLYDAPISKEVLDSYGPKHYVQERPGEDVRCTGYCSACKFCNYYKNTYENKTDLTAA